MNRYICSLKKQGKQSRKKNLSKETIRKIVFKQAMHATTEIRQSKSYEQKLACNIKNDSNTFFAYVRSKQNVKTRSDL